MEADDIGSDILKLSKTFEVAVDIPSGGLGVRVKVLMLPKRFVDVAGRRRRGLLFMNKAPHLIVGSSYYQLLI